jgi:hypothetical protein
VLLTAGNVFSLDEREAVVVGVEVGRMGPSHRLSGSITACCHRTCRSICRERGPGLGSPRGRSCGLSLAHWAARRNLGRDWWE